MDTKWPEPVAPELEPTPEQVASHDATAKPIIPNLMLVYNMKAPVIFITARRLKYRESTVDWLKRHNLHSVLIMRPNEEVMNHGDFKQKWIKVLLEQGNPTKNTPDTVVVIDDDPDGSVKKVCQENGWVHLQVNTPVVVEAPKQEEK